MLNIDQYNFWGKENVGYRYWPKMSYRCIPCCPTFICWIYMLNLFEGPIQWQTQWSDPVWHKIHWNGSTSWDSVCINPFLVLNTRWGYDTCHCGLINSPLLDFLTLFCSHCSPHVCIYPCYSVVWCHTDTRDISVILMSWWCGEDKGRGDQGTVWLSATRPSQGLAAIQVERHWLDRKPGTSKLKHKYFLSEGDYQ